jgi:hypothetical protein
MKPFRNGARFKVEVRKLERMIGKFTSQLQRMIDLIVQWLPLVEPAEPAEISEDSAADHGALNLRKPALSFEVRTEDRISRIFTRAALNDCSGKSEKFVFHEAR